MRKMSKPLCFLLSVIMLVCMLAVVPTATASAEDGDSFTAQVNGRWVKGEKQQDENGDAVFRFLSSELSHNVVICRVNPAAVDSFDELADQWAADVVWNKSDNWMLGNGNVCYLYAIENGTIRASWKNQTREGGYFYMVAQEPVKNDGAVIYIWTYETLLLTEHDAREASYDEETGEAIPGCATTYYTAYDERYFIDDGSGGYQEVSEEELFTIMPGGDQKILGDADGDGVVTVVDATAIQRVLASIEVEAFDPAAADADPDGVVTILDATQIQRFLVSLPCPEGIGEPIVK